MIAFVLNIALAFMWTLATERVSVANFVVGYVLGYLVLLLARPTMGDPRYFRKLPQAIFLVVFFVWELLLANFRVAFDVVTPRDYMRPGVIAYPLQARTDYEITLLALFITLTPGTLSLDVSDDRRFLYIHGMFVDDPAAVRAAISNTIERRILEVMR